MATRLPRTIASRSTRATLLLGLLLAPLFVSGQSGLVSVSAVVEQIVPPTPSPTKVIFKGLAYPGSQVTLQQDGKILATVPADPTARFEIEVTGFVTGIYTFTIFAEDELGRVGRVSNFTISITQGATTTVNGIFLGPTIAADKASIKLAETVSLLGATAPSSEVTIFVSSEEERTFKTNAGGNGLWLKQFLGSDLGLGTHSMRVKAVAPSQEISAFSNTVSLSVTEAAPDPCDGKRPGDLNCDGKVNLRDFSIMLFYWKKKNPPHPRVDINKDGVVNIRDLSILLFWWTK